MPVRESKLDSALVALDRALNDLRSRITPPVSAAIDRWRSDADALRFHLRDDGADHPMLVAIVGGTGTGKSTLVNRLIGENLTATSFRRTFTSGAVAITAYEKNLPDKWLGVEHRLVADIDIPARGQADTLAVITESSELTSKLTIIDTPDLDGDQPLHHAQAERVFRWAQAVVFLVTPEKYQMVELLPYYRLAKRYAIPALFVMNKAEESGVVDDFKEQLAVREWTDARIFAIPRDDATWEPAREMNLTALKDAITSIMPPERKFRREGLARRAADLLGRLQDQILAPLRSDRQHADALLASIKALETPGLGVDVNPLSQGLQKRLQQRSVLYLMGPQRVIERVRQVPGMILRMPRTIWDVVMKGQGIRINDPERAKAQQANGQAVPDFKANVSDQFQIVQSRIEDVLRSSPAGQRWLTVNESTYKTARFDPTTAGNIAAEELADLEKWLEQRWNATPRDTLLLMKLLRHLPGGQKLTKWTEAAPYLLAVVVATHSAIFGPIDLMVLGGFSLATWLTEKLSNEVAQRTRATNRRIGERFSELAHKQIEQIVGWVDAQAPLSKELDLLEQLGEKLHSAAGEEEIVGLAVPNVSDQSRNTFGTAEPTSND